MLYIYYKHARNDTDGLIVYYIFAGRLNTWTWARSSRESMPWDQPGKSVPPKTIVSISVANSVCCRIRYLNPNVYCIYAIEQPVIQPKKQSTPVSCL